MLAKKDDAPHWFGDKQDWDPVNYNYYSFYGWWVQDGTTTKVTDPQHLDQLNYPKKWPVYRRLNNPHLFLAHVAQVESLLLIFIFSYYFISLMI